MKSAHITVLLILVALIAGFGILTSTKSSSTPKPVPMGQKVYAKDLAPLPTECKNVNDDCWRESVANGSIKFIGPMVVYKK